MLGHIRFSNISNNSDTYKTLEVGDIPHNLDFSDISDISDISSTFDSNISDIYDISDVSDTSNIKSECTT